MPSKWAGLDGPTFRFEDLGRPAVFLIPAAKLLRRINNRTVSAELEDFLVSHFGAFTRMTISNFGIWMDGHKKIIHDESSLYEVSFAGKEKITLLAAKLAEIAKVIGEECIYFKAGQYASLIYPKI